MGTQKGIIFKNESSINSSLKWFVCFILHAKPFELCRLLSGSHNGWTHCSYVRKENILIRYDFYKAKSLIMLHSNTDEEEQP